MQTTPSSSCVGSFTNHSMLCVPNGCAKLTLPTNPGASPLQKPHFLVYLAQPLTTHSAMANWMFPPLRPPQTTSPHSGPSYILERNTWSLTILAYQKMAALIIATQVSILPSPLHIHWKWYLGQPRRILENAHTSMEAIFILTIGWTETNFTSITY